MIREGRRPGAVGEARAAAAERVLRGGEVCRIEDAAGDRLVTAIDVVGRGAWAGWLGTPLAPRLVLSGTRARAVGIAIAGQACAAIQMPHGCTADLVEALVGGGGTSLLASGLPVAHATTAEAAAVELAKRAGLLPAVLSLAAPQPGIEPTMTVEARIVLEQPWIDVGTLEAAVEVRLPTVHAETARLVASFQRNGTRASGTIDRTAGGCGRTLVPTALGMPDRRRVRLPALRLRPAAGRGAGAHGG